MNRFTPILVGAALLGCTPTDADTLATYANPPPTQTLEATPALAGESLSLRVLGLQPGARTLFLRGTAEGAGPCPGPLNDCLGIVDPVVMGVARANASGRASLVRTLPDTLPIGTEVVFQAAMPSTGETTQVLATTVSHPEALPDFSIADVNPTSPRFGDQVSPRDYLEAVSGWYFGHAT